MISDNDCEDSPLDWDTESPAHLQMGVSAAIHFDCSTPSDRECDDSKRSSQHMETKIDMIYNLLAVLGEQENADIGETFLNLSSNPESCLAMRQSGCLPLLVKLIQSDKDSETRKKAVQALHNLINCQPDEKIRIREIKLLKLLQILSSYAETLDCEENCNNDHSTEDMREHPIQTIARIAKLSFDESYRQTMCLLGAIHTIVKLLESEYSKHGVLAEERNCNILRSHACMTLTNVTFGDSGNKALLCSYKDFIKFLVEQLHCHCDDLRQVTANILRNLSWRADSTSKETLREVGAVENLMKTAMLNNRENTLISILSALWNLSAHSLENKNAICSLDGALDFLIGLLNYKSPFDSTNIVENSGGILKNISTQIAESEDYRNILRKSQCFQILVDQLKSPNSTIASNACGTLWNLSTHDTADNQLLCSFGAIAVLETLNQSKHKMIAAGSNAILKNLSRFQSEQKYSTQSRNFDKIAKLPCDKVNPSNSDQNVSGRSSCLLDKSMELKSSSLICLSMCESVSSSDGKRTRMLLKEGSLSLPHVYTTKHKNTVVTDSNMFENYNELPEETPNLGRRYSETRRDNGSENKCLSSYEQSKNESFSIYAETDLDQPTDYSLRYAENDADTDSEVDEDCIITEKTSVGFVTDTVKTYCTEGTPYETPANFSTSTSISDLRIIDKNNVEIEKLATKEEKANQLSMVSIAIPVNSKTDHLTESNDVQKSKQPVNSKLKSEFSSGLASPEKPMNYCEEGTPGYFSRVSSLRSLNSTSALTGEGKVPENKQPISSKLKSEFSSGLASPEKPMNYCEEGTPGYFSRVSSLGSLNSTPASTGEGKLSPKKDESNDEIPMENGHQQKISASESKMVKFEENVNFYEETPLMFSRSSSLGSLDSIEQQSIHDDRSSLISDFSRLTSGIISPSELPDSPTQTAPSSPKPLKSREYQIIGVSTECKSNPIKRNLPKTSVFEDDVTKFKEENTPIQFSTTTSLSNLTIEDPEENDIQESTMNDGVHINQDEQHYSTEPIAVPRLTNWKNGLPENNDLCMESSSQQNSSQTISLPIALNHCTGDPTKLNGIDSVSGTNLKTHFFVDGTAKTFLSKESYAEENKNNNSMEEKIHSKLQVKPKHYFDVNRIEPSSISTDEITFFTVEDSPVQFSLRSSLSSLTFRSDNASGLDNSFHSKSISKPSSVTQENEDTVSNVEYNDVPHMQGTNHLKSEKSQSVENIEESGIIDSFSSRNENKEDYVETQNTLTYHGSLKRKKWKWKWKLKPERLGENNTKETSSEKEFITLANMQVENTGINRINGTDNLNYGSLDASFRKKKWWKWIHNSKEAEYPHNSQRENIQHLQTSSTLNKEDSKNTEKNGNLSDKSNFSRNVSKRWKWRWKFSSENKSDVDPSGSSKSTTTDGPRSLIETIDNNKSCNSDEGETISRIQREPSTSTVLPQTKSQHFSNTAVNQRIKKDTEEKNEKFILKQNPSSSMDDVDSSTKFLLDINRDRRIYNDSNQTRDNCSNFNEEAHFIEDGEYVELRKAIQIPESSISEASSCSSIAEVSDVLKSDLKEESSQSETVEMNSESSQSFNSINTNDFEFLKRQVKMTDKHHLWELIENGISKKEEIILVRDLVLKRIKEENEIQAKSLTPANISPSSTEMRMSQKKNIFEEPLDPMTLCIVKRILRCLANNVDDLNNQSKNLDTEETPLYSDVECESETFTQINEKAIEQLISKESPMTSSINASSISIDGNLQNVVPHSKTEKIFQLQEPRNESHNNINLSKSHDTKDYAVLIEECIQLGMPKKKEIEQETIYANVPKFPGYSCTSPIPRKELSSLKNSERRTKMPDKNDRLTDAQALIEECIKLGMPKKIGETSRWTKQQNIISESYNLRTPVSKVDNNQNDDIPEERCSAFSTSENKVRKDSDEQKGEAIYANVSNTIGYSRCHKIEKFEKSSSFSPSIIQPQNGTRFDTEGAGASNYFSNIRDCVRTDINNAETSSLEIKSALPTNTPNYESLIEECILLGMPKNKDLSTKHINSHSAFASLSRGVPRSYSEPSNLRNPFANFIQKPFPAVNNSSIGNYRETTTSLTSSEIDSVNGNHEVHTTSGRFISKKQKETRSKNVNVASVVRNIKLQRGALGVPILATDAIGLETRGVLDKIKISSRNIVQKKNGFSYISVNNSRRERDS